MENTKDALVDMKEKQLVKVLMLLITFIPSQPLFWKIIENISGQNDIYVVQQFMFASFFALLSVWLTDDINFFNGFWEKCPKWKRGFEKILHGCTVIVMSFLKMPMWLLCVMDDNYKKEDYERYKADIDVEICKYDNMPLVLRIMFPIALIAILLNFLLAFDLISLNVQEWIFEVLSFVISLIGFVFVAANAVSKKNS